MTGNSVGGPASKGRAELMNLWSTARKILGQEIRTGCVDRTVLGGLDRYLERWSASIFSSEAAFPTCPEAVQVGRLLSDNGALNSTERGAALRGALAVVDEVLDRMAALPAGDEGSWTGEAGRAVVPSGPARRPAPTNPIKMR